MSEQQEKQTIVWAIGAHPDDIEFQFGGTLAKLRKLHGDKVAIYMITINNGNMGSMVLDAIALRETRGYEAPKAAELIGAHYDTCEIQDVRGPNYAPIATDILVGQARQIKPHIVLTRSPNDNYMGDHRVVADIVNDALFWAMLPNYDPTDPHNYPWFREGDPRTDIRTRKEC